MKIGIDIDGVIVDTINFCAREFSDHFGYEITCEDIAHWFDRIKGGGEFLSGKEDYLLCSLEPWEDAVAAVNLLHEKHELFFISSRQKTAYNSTLKWLKKYGIPYRNLILTAGKSKAGVCKELGLDVFIEDSAVNASDIVKHGIPVILYRTEYNSWFKNSMAVHCDSWREILNTLGSFKSDEDSGFRAKTQDSCAGSIRTDSGHKR